MPHDPTHAPTAAARNAANGIRPFKHAKTSELVIVVARYAATAWPRKGSDQVEAAIAELDIRLPVP